MGEIYIGFGMICRMARSKLTGASGHLYKPWTRNDFNHYHSFAKSIDGVEADKNKSLNYLGHDQAAKSKGSVGIF